MNTTDYSEVLDRVEEHLGRYIAVPDDRDLSLLTLWAAHTHLVVETYTSPRLLLDSTMPGSGKTTVLDHLHRLTADAVMAAALSSPALLARILEDHPRTILIDETDRSLAQDKPNVGELIAILNSGYRKGASRPVLVPDKEKGWVSKEMSTYAPVALAGNSPRLPDDTRSRCIRVLLMPDLDGRVEDSDWEVIDDDVTQLHDMLAAFADAVRHEVAGMPVDLPAGCIGRSREKWRPLKRVAVAAGGHWPDVVDELIQRGLDEDRAERDAGLLSEPPGMVMMRDLHRVWIDDQKFIDTESLVSMLIAKNPEMWGMNSPYGKALTAKRLGALVSQASKITSIRPGGRGKRGYTRAALEPVWHRLGIGRKQSGACGDHGGSGADDAPDQP